MPNRLRLRSAVFWLVVAATLFAAFSRLCGLLTLPPQAWVDEIWFALRARELLQTGQFQIFYKTFWGGVNPMLVYLTAAAQRLALSDVIVSSRAVSAVFGLLSVPLAFACLDEFWHAEWPAARRRWSAALTAVVLSNFFSMVALSRLGTEPALALTAGLFCLWQMRRALRTGSWGSYALAGLGAGWAQYISPHARFIPVVIALFGLHDFVVASPSHRWRLLRGLALSAAAAALAAAPLLAFFVREPEWFLGRARAVTIGVAQRGPAESLLANARAIALSFSFLGDANPRDNLARRPYLDVIQSAGFYLGLGWVLWRLRSSARARDLLVWLGVMIAPSLVTDNAPSFSRMVQVAPPAAALIVVGWGLALDWARPRLGQGLAAALAGLAVAASLLVNGYDYFVRYAGQPDLPAAFAVTPVRLAREMTERARTEAAFVERIAEAEEDIYAFDFLLPGTAVRRLDFRQCLPLTDRRAARTTYLVWSQHDAAAIPELQRAYPTAAVSVIHPESEALVRELTLVEVPPEVPAPAFARPAAVRFAPGLRLLGYEQSPLAARPGESVLFTLYWKAEAEMDEDVVGFIHVGTGLAGSRFLVGHDGQPCQGLYPTSQWRPGDVVPDRFAVVLPPDAPPGEYPVAVGWYRYPSLKRLPLESADQSLPDNRAIIGTVTVVAP